MDYSNVKPVISIIMPAYNCEQYIEKAIKSVIDQTIYQKTELFVIDDCSADNTKEKVEQFREYNQIYYIRNDVNSGVAFSRNKGIKLAQGKYIAFLDADDWWSADKLEKQLKCLENGKEVLCCTGRELMTHEGEPTGKTIGVPEYITYNMLLKTNSIPCSSVIMKTSVAREFYMTHDELHEDYILWLNVLKKYKNAVGIDEPMLKSRLSIGGKSRNKFKSAKMQYGVYRYMGYGFLKSMFYLLNYMVNGIMKYK